MYLLYPKTAELPSTFPNTSRSPESCPAPCAQCLEQIFDASSPIIYLIVSTAKKCWLAVASLGLTTTSLPTPGPV